MGTVTPNQLLGVGVAFLIIPTIILLFKRFRDTRITDYLIFCSFLFFAFIALIADPLASYFNSLILYQIHHISIDSAVFSISLHAMRVMWSKIPKLFLALTTSWYLFLFVLTLSWHLMLQPAQGVFLFIKIPHMYSTYFPLGAGLTLNNGVIIYSTAYRYFGEFYRTIIVAFLVWAYIRIEPLESNPKILRAKKLWTIAWIFVLIHALSLYPFLNITNVVSIFLIVAGIIIAYITITSPEALLISHIQIHRFLQMYTNILDKNKNQYMELQEKNKQIFDYLKTISTEKLLEEN